MPLINSCKFLQQQIKVSQNRQLKRVRNSYIKISTLYDFRSGEVLYCNDSYAFFESHNDLIMIGSCQLSLTRVLRNSCEGAKDRSPREETSIVM